jgi:hypothetical protein
MKHHVYVAAIGCAVLAISTSIRPALADTRDDVLAAMQRCSVMQDDRTWLECTYGAQQLMRAKLGLQPAPDYQQRLVPPASAARAPLASAPPPPLPATAPPVRAAVASAPPPTRRRGSFMQILGGTAPPVAVSPLAAVNYDSRAAFTVTLQNGQVWRQINGEGEPKARFHIGEKITIQPGVMGTYNLKTDSNSHPYKVERRS